MRCIGDEVDPPESAVVRKVAHEICRAVTGGDCVMDEKDGREYCNERNCRIMPIARQAILSARLPTGR